MQLATQVCLHQHGYKYMRSTSLPISIPLFCFLLIFFMLFSVLKNCPYPSQWTSTGAIFPLDQMPFINV